MITKRPKMGFCSGLLGFAFAAVCAYLQKWTSGELVWGFWATSLIVGYLWAVALIVATQVRAERQRRNDYPRSGAWAIAGFVTFLFVFTHWGYAGFLNSFFPLHKSGMGFSNFGLTIWLVASSQWGLVLSVVISRFREFPRGGLIEMETATAEEARSEDGDDPLLGNAVRNMAQLHITIFALLGITFLRTILDSKYSWLRTSDTPTLYAILALYFLPWRLVTLTAIRRGNNKANQALHATSEPAPDAASSAHEG